jgi:hypothetical protein
MSSITPAAADGCRAAPVFHSGEYLCRTAGLPSSNKPPRHARLTDEDPSAGHRQRGRMELNVLRATMRAGAGAGEIVARRGLVVL